MRKGKSTRLVSGASETRRWLVVSVLVLLVGSVVALFAVAPARALAPLNYIVVDTGQDGCFDDRKAIPCPGNGQDYDGQDAQFKGNTPAYHDNGDGTVTDLNTGLMWVKERGEKMHWQDALDGASKCRVAGYDDWRAPTIKELYSLIDFRGYSERTAKESKPYLDTRFFDFAFGDTSKGERIIDCQDWSATKYVGTTMGGAQTAFGVNFADGRIKGYPTMRGKRDKRYMRYVRGNPNYGENKFVDNGDGTVTDGATGLVWQKADSGKGMNWKDALAYAQDLDLAGHDDWRLPNAKELQSIVDYTRSPTTTGSAAIDPVFSVTDKESYFWTGTTHLEHGMSTMAVYIAFGRAMGWMELPPGSGTKTFMDVHGAGAQRSDPKTGDPDDWPQGHGPQGDDRRVLNYVRCVRDGAAERVTPAYKPSSQSSGGMEGPPPGKEGQGPGGMRTPPAEAFDACQGKSEGSSCSVRTPKGSLSGTCTAHDQGLFCRPER